MKGNRGRLIFIQFLVLCLVIVAVSRGEQPTKITQVDDIFMPTPVEEIKLDQHLHKSDSILNVPPLVVLSEKSDNSVQQPIVLSSSGQVVSGTVSSGSFDLYRITISSSDYLTLSFSLNSISSSVSVYIGEGRIPTSFNYDYSILSQYSVRSIYPSYSNSTTTYYISVNGDYAYSYSSYILTASVNSYGPPAWMIGVIVGSVIIGIIILFLAFILPVLICLGICGCVCCAASNTTSVSQPVNTVATYTTVHTPILSPQTPIYYEHQDTAYYNPNVHPYTPTYQPQYPTYQKI